MKSIDDINLGSFRATNATPAQCFDKLRDEYGLNSYFIGKKLYIGFANNARSSTEREYIMEEVCINSNYLQYQRAEDIIVKVKCVPCSLITQRSRLKQATKTGAKDIPLLQHHLSNGIKNIAEQRVKDQKYTGFRGWMETLGQPLLKHGDICKIVSKSCQRRNGSYLIKSVLQKVRSEHRLPAII
jgi:hypothetical protein